MYILYIDTSLGPQHSLSSPFFHLEKLRQILYNNLGGFGPGHLDQPMLMRFEKTCAIDDQRVDLVGLGMAGSVVGNWEIYPLVI